MDTALILTGGGARAAYQVGALLGLKSICEKHDIAYPFSIYSGCSAGAINMAFLANEHDKRFSSLPLLERLWTSIHTHNVYRTDFYSIVGIARKLVWDVFTGRYSKYKDSNGMLDSSPLKELIEKYYDERKVANLIASGQLKGVGISAFNYSNNVSEYFFQADDSIQEWQSMNRVATKTTIRASHIYASSAIPVMFPFVEIDGQYYGDGSLRNYKPLNPSLHMGADKLFVIGVSSAKQVKHAPRPSTSRVVSTMLNSILLDSTHLELHYINKINELVKKSSTDTNQLKDIKTFVLRPSIDVGELAIGYRHKLPKIIWHLIRGLGATKEAGDLISYLLFEPQFTKKLIELGKQDALEQEQAILQFFT